MVTLSSARRQMKLYNPVEPVFNVNNWSANEMEKKLVLVLHYLWWKSAKSTESRVTGSGVMANLEWTFHSKEKNSIIIYC